MDNEKKVTESQDQMPPLMFWNLGTDRFWKGPRCKHCGWPISNTEGFWSHHLGQEIKPGGMPKCQNPTPRKESNDE